MSCHCRRFVVGGLLLLSVAGVFGYGRSAAECPAIPVAALREMAVFGDEFPTLVATQSASGEYAVAAVRLRIPGCRRLSVPLVEAPQIQTMFCFSEFFFDRIAILNPVEISFHNVLPARAGPENDRSPVVSADVAECA